MPYMNKAITIFGSLNTFSNEFFTEIFATLANNQKFALSCAPRNEKEAEFAEAIRQSGGKLSYYYDNCLKEDGLLFRFRRGLKRLEAHYRVNDYDLVHINGVSIFSFLAALRAKKTARVVVSYWGSDLLRASKLALLTMRPLLKRADAITVETSYVKERLLQLFKGQFADKVTIAMFGTKNAELMNDFVKNNTREDCKWKMGLPVEKVCIFCGYSGSRAHRHKEIAKLLETLPENVRDRLCLVFHCAYGLDSSYREELEKLAAESTLDCRLLTKFMTGADLASLRMCADVMLNLQLTDSISTTMLESLEAGAIVIKGDWLNYPELEERKPYMLSIPSVEALPELIQDIVENLDSYRERTKQNSGIVLIQSWNAVRGRWMKALGEK